MQVAQGHHLHKASSRQLALTFGKAGFSCQGVVQYRFTLCYTGHQARSLIDEDLIDSSSLKELSVVFFLNLMPMGFFVQTPVFFEIG
jgi:hypothetical protein